MDDLSGIYSGQEKLLMGLYVNGHPLREIHRQAQADYRIISARDLHTAQPDQAVKMLGRVVSLKSVTTKSKQAMAFVTMEDATGEYSVTVFPMMLLMFASVLVKDTLLLLDGKVSHRPDHKKAKAVEGEEEQMTASVRFELVLDRAELYTRKN